MAINTSGGALVYICATATKASTVSALSALTYVLIGKVENLGEIGPQHADVPFTPLGGDPVQHLKGPLDNGAMTLICAKDPLDAGQIAMITAAGTKFEYALKIVEEDAADANDTDSTTYVRGPVMGGRKTIGGAADITKRTFMVGLNFYQEVASTAVS